MLKSNSKVSLNPPNTDENDKKEVEKESELKSDLKTTTKTSNLFVLSKFDAADAYEERLPKNFKDLEHLLKIILMSLEETENVFINQAKAVMDRDLTLITWRLRLKNLYTLLGDKKRDFERIDQTVECILKLSTHIDDILVKLENELPGLNLVENAFKYTPARMTMHEDMIKTNISQKDMLEQISNTVLNINETIDCNLADPVDQLTKILSLHLEVLKAIEKKTRLAEEQLRIIKSLFEFYTKNKEPLICACFYS